MNNIMMFEGNNVEIFEYDGKVLFNPKHVAKCLDLGDSGLRNHLADMNENKRVKLTNSTVLIKDFRKLHNTGEVFITESGVYDLIFKSRKKEAIVFKDWVTDEVLPSIRKDGGYINVNDNDDESTIMAKALIVAQKAIERKSKELEEAIRRNNILMHVNRTYTATEIAKELGFKSAVALNKDLCDKGIQYKVNKTYVLKSEYSELGYISIKQQILDSGSAVYNRHFTQDGRNFILNLYNN